MNQVSPSGSALDNYIAYPENSEEHKCSSNSISLVSSMNQVSLSGSALDNYIAYPENAK